MNTWLLLVAGAHLGFQLTVDLVVYPALRDVGPEDWTRAHAAHSRRITPVVGLVYVPLVLVLGWAAVAEPDDVGTWVAVAGGLLAVGTTAAVAAPVHGRLSSAGEDRRAALLDRLTRADRVRTVGAVVCTVGALLVAL
ncbi:DUF1772 domain-containing protein [Nocardioides KLBMP 9356]|uniref:DUF1772 domain-containing protein n=1 Tax=Nocardioides potassii TaxID=2911371 RepID=A0ABS9HBV0_9ACTN|nr:DUF1772 domain-containing protein [Nocardioides potassii]MCF6378667.1 DUF1772 domain-containing protein [Nocardioides potassii]